MSALTIGSSEIRQINGLYSLNDLHVASGGNDNFKPVFFLRNAQTVALIEEIKGANSHLLPLKIEKGRNGGTYACKELVIAYAAWISPAFHLKVIRVFLAQAGRTLPDTISKAQQGELATLIAERFPSGKDRPYAWSRFNNHFRLASYKDLPANRFDEACEYIKQMPELAPALPKPKQVSGATIPEEQAREIMIRLNRVWSLFHPMSDQFLDLLGISRLMQGLNPKLGMREPRYLEIVRKGGAK